ncbi:MAG: LytTR family DNA-binding domain-containing protein [Bacteroidales bacterium]
MSRIAKIPGIWLLDSSGAVKIDPEEIAYCYHNNDITRIVYSGGNFLKVHVPLKKIEEKLCKWRFYRCHRNYLINLNLAGDFPDEADVITLARNRIVPVSRRRRNNLRSVLKRPSSGRGFSV